MAQVNTNINPRTGNIAYHEYRGVYMIPQVGKLRVTRHYWHGAYRPQLFSTIQEAVRYIDNFLDMPSDMPHSVSDGFLCIEKESK